MPTSNEPPAPQSRPALPRPFIYSTPQPTLQYQGAEALLYRTTFLSSETSPSANEQQDQPIPAIPAALKHRPSKPYRHPLLDAKLTRARILAEARVLAKLHREGVSVPRVLALDWAASAAGDASSHGTGAQGGWMLMEWIEGETVRAVLDRELGTYNSTVLAADDSETAADNGGATDVQEGLMRLMERIGRLVARVHGAGVVHGDLTTSNLMVRMEGGGGSLEGREEESKVVLVDFGLAFQSNAEEDRAVDLYVLERAFGSSHPRTERLFREILRAYGEAFKPGRAVLKRLEEVRMRGRKKIMIG